jgi:hypothetical protein
MTLLDEPGAPGWVKKGCNAPRLPACWRPLNSRALFRSPQGSIKSSSSARPHEVRRATLGEHGACVLRNCHAAKKSCGPKNSGAPKSLFSQPSGVVYGCGLREHCAKGERADDQSRYRYGAVFLHGSYRHRNRDRRGDAVRLAGQNCSRSDYRAGRRLPRVAHESLIAKPARCEGVVGNVATAPRQVHVTAD